jgi:hypothetical protein
VILPTKSDTEIKKRYITQPTEHQKILLQYIKLALLSFFVDVLKQNIKGCYGKLSPALHKKTINITQTNSQQVTSFSRP